MTSGFMERLAEGPLLVDGGYYLEFERRCLGSYASKSPMGVLDYPFRFRLISAKGRHI